jgi:enoyl-CoA hydratase
MSQTVLISEVGGGVVHCAMTRPDKRNALNPDLITALLDLTQLVQSRKEIVGVLLTGGDSPDFCAGGDLDYLNGLSKAEALGFSDRVYELCIRIESSPALWCAVLKGRTLGGGAELALACDRRYATECATLSFTQLKMGLPSGWGGFHRLVSHVGRSTAIKMILKAQSLDAAAQVEAGLAELINGDELTMFKADIAGWCTEDPAVIRSALETLKSGGQRAVEQAAFSKCWGQQAHRNALRSFLDRHRG